MKSGNQITNLCLKINIIIFGFVGKTSCIQTCFINNELLIETTWLSWRIYLRNYTKNENKKIKIRKAQKI